MSYSVRKTEGGRWGIYESKAGPSIKTFAYRKEAREHLRAFKAGRIDMDGEPKHDTSLWRNAATPIADNH